MVVQYLQKCIKIKYFKDLSTWLDLLRSSMVEKALVGFVTLDLLKFLKIPYILYWPLKFLSTLH
jgi:hypothetical protein